MPISVPNFFKAQTPLGAALNGLASTIAGQPSDAEQQQEAGTIQKQQLDLQNAQRQSSAQSKLGDLFTDPRLIDPTYSPTAAPAPPQLGDMGVASTPINRAFQPDYGQLAKTSVDAGYKPEDLGKMLLVMSANGGGARAQGTQNAQVGTGENFNATAGAFDTGQNNDMTKAANTNATSVANNAATNATSRANNHDTIAAENQRAAASRAPADPLGLGNLVNQPAGAPAAQPGNGAANSMRDEAFLTQLEQQHPGLGGLVKSIADGKTPMIGNYALTKPAGQQLAELVMRYDPSADAASLPGRVALRRSMVAGPMAQNAQSLNTVAQHIGKLADDSDTLGGTAFPAINMVKNFVSKQTGGTAPGNFNTDADAVATELTRSFRGNSGALADIQAWRANLDPNASPEQRKQSIQHIVGLLGGRIEALGDTYNKGMGTTEDPFNLLSPGAKATFDRLTPGATGAAPAPVQGGWTVKKVGH